MSAVALELEAERVQAAILAGRPADAIGFADELLERPAPPRASQTAAIHRARALGIMGRLDEARGELDGAARGRSRTTSSVAAGGWRRSARSSSGAGRPERAIELDAARSWRSRHRSATRTCSRNHHPRLGAPRPRSGRRNRPRRRARRGSRRAPSRSWPPSPDSRPATRRPRPQSFDARPRCGPASTRLRALTCRWAAGEAHRAGRGSRLRSERSTTALDDAHADGLRGRSRSGSAGRCARPASGRRPSPILARPQGSD